MILPTIWFNRHFQGTFAHINALADSGKYTVYVSHAKDSVPSMQNHAELSRESIVKFKEPDDLNLTQYVAWCLAFCKEHRIAVFIPGKAKEWVARKHKAFEAVGTRVMVAGSERTIRVLDRKDQFLSKVDGLVPTAAWRPFKTVQEFDLAWKSLGSGKTMPLCVKPAQGIYGSGFWRLTNGLGQDSLFKKDTLTTKQFKERLKTTPPEQWLLMQYCAGDERSVDCVTHQGELFVGVIRRKTKHGIQVIEDHPEILGHAKALVKKFNLSGLVNVQFKEHDGVPYILEINPRASGGSGMAYLSGVPLMPLAVDALLSEGKNVQAPTPLFGAKIHKTNLYFTVNDEGLPHDSN